MAEQAMVRTIKIVGLVMDHSWKHWLEATRKPHLRDTLTKGDTDNDDR